MDNIKFIDTMILVGELKTKDEALIKRLISNDLEVDKIYKVVTKFITENKTNDIHKWDIIDKFVELFDTCVFDGYYINGIKEILEIYKFKYKDKYIKNLAILYKEMCNIVYKFKKDYIIELDDLRIVGTYGDIEYAEKKIEAQRIVSQDSIEYLLVGNEEIYAYIVGYDDKVYMVKRSEGLDSFVNSLIKYRYKLAIIPTLFDSTQRIILNKYNKSYLDNEEYLKFLRIFSSNSICNNRSVKLLDDIKKSSYDFKDIIESICIDIDIHNGIRLLERIYGLSCIESTSDKELKDLSNIIKIYGNQIDIEGNKLELMLKHRGRSIKEFTRELKVLNIDNIISIHSRETEVLFFKNGFQRITKTSINKCDRQEVTGNEYKHINFIVKKNKILEVKDLENCINELDTIEGVLICGDKSIGTLK